MGGKTGRPKGSVGKGAKTIKSFRLSSPSLNNLATLTRIYDKSEGDIINMLLDVYAPMIIKRHEKIKA